MKTPEIQAALLVLFLMAAVEFIRVSGSAACNPAVLKLYGWCEQWACADNCTCLERPDCRQYCDGLTCKDMRCLSPNICKQKVISASSHFVVHYELINSDQRFEAFSEPGLRIILGNYSMRQ